MNLTQKEGVSCIEAPSIVLFIVILFRLAQKPSFIASIFLTSSFVFIYTQIIEPYLERKPIFVNIITRLFIYNTSTKIRLNVQ